MAKLHQTQAQYATLHCTQTQAAYTSVTRKTRLLKVGVRAVAVVKVIGARRCVEFFTEFVGSIVEEAVFATWPLQLVPATVNGAVGLERFVLLRVAVSEEAAMKRVQFAEGVNSGFEVCVRRLRFAARNPLIDDVLIGKDRVALIDGQRIESGDVQPGEWVLLGERSSSRRSRRN